MSDRFRNYEEMKTGRHPAACTCVDCQNKPLGKKEGIFLMLSSAFFIVLARGVTGGCVSSGEEIPTASPTVISTPITEYSSSLIPATATVEPSKEIASLLRENNYYVYNYYNIDEAIDDLKDKVEAYADMATIVDLAGINAEKYVSDWNSYDNKDNDFGPYILTNLPESAHMIDVDGNIIDNRRDSIELS